MLAGKKVLVVLPAYNAERTLERTISEIPRDVVDDLLLVDDASGDATVRLAQQLGLRTIVHDANQGYGANQKTCYREALRCGADIVIMLHPDYQYSPKLLPAMAGMIASEEYDAVIGSRILGNGALRGGMPLYKYIANRVLTATQNFVLGEKLSEYHTGYRAFSREVLKKVAWASNNDGFVFDNQMLCQILFLGYRVGEVSCPTHYFPEASSIRFAGSVRYGLGVLGTTISCRFAKWGWRGSRIFQKPPSGAAPDET